MSYQYLAYFKPLNTYFIINILTHWLKTAIISSLRSMMMGSMIYAIFSICYISYTILKCALYLTSILFIIIAQYHSHSINVLNSNIEYKQLFIIYPQIEPNLRPNKQLNLVLFTCQDHNSLSSNLLQKYLSIFRLNINLNTLQLNIKHNQILNIIYLIS